MQRTSSTSSGTDRIWLDELPTDVCNRITFTLYRDHGPIGLLDLAYVSTPQRNVVKHVLHYKIDLFELEGHCVGAKEEIAALLQDDVREIEAVGEDVYQEFVQRCLRSSTLKRLYVCNLPFDIDITKDTTNLRGLHLRFTTNNFPLSLLRRLSVLPLREFSLYTASKTCLRKLFTEDPKNHSLLATWFPLVENLDLQCSCDWNCRSAARLQYLWHAIAPFPRLKQVTLSERVLDDAVEKLKQMERVNIRMLHAEDTLDAISKLADHVICVRCDHLGALYRGIVGHDMIFQDQLESFTMCTRLEKLEVSTRRGAEIELEKIVGNLRYLSVGVDDVVSEVQDNDSGEGKGRNEAVYEPRANAISNAVKAAPFLKELRLYNMRIQRSELRDILVSLGRRAEVFIEYLPSRLFENSTFQYPVEENKEILEELIAVYTTAAIHNPFLQRLYLPLESSWFTDRAAVESLLPRFEMTIQWLYRRVPFVYTGLSRGTLQELGGDYEYSQRSFNEDDES